MAVGTVPWRGRRGEATSSTAAPPDTVDRRQAVLVALRSSDHPLAVPDLAELLDVHPNTIRFHLDALVERGQVERLSGHSTRPGRPRALYRVLAVMDPEGPRQYRTLAAVLVAELAATPDGTARATAAGRRWGAALDPPTVVDLPGGAGAVARTTAHLVALLDDFGFAPRSNEGSDPRVELWQCPFLELAESAPDVVCGAHLGLMQGALAAWGSPLSVDRLERFARPGCCIAHLNPAEPTP